MEMGGRAEALEIDVLFYSLFVDGEFAKFSPLVIEGYSSRGVII